MKNSRNNGKNSIAQKIGTIGLAALALSLLAAGGCRKEAPVFEGENVVLARAGCTSAFRLVSDPYATGDTLADKIMLANIIKARTGAEIKEIEPSDVSAKTPYLLAFGAYDIRECSELMFGLGADEYAISCSETAAGVTVSIAFKSPVARLCAIERLLADYFRDGTLAVPKDLNVRGSVTAEDHMITTGVSLRDPCILAENGAYYMYGTGWKLYKNSGTDLASGWEGPFSCVEAPEDQDGNLWAPEVYHLKDRDRDGYYMFTTYHSSVTGHRGVAVFRADTPEGPFRLHSDGHVTPADRDCIDGTLYIDKDGTPWMVFVREWTGTPDNIGRMDVARLSDDLTHFVSEPKELFTAQAASWCDAQVTDGPWLYNAKNGSLLMIWSNFEGNNAYAVGLARSNNGKVNGSWSQLDRMVYSATVSGSFDGGHGMLFTASDGRLYMSLHSPNTPTDERKTLAVFIPIIEESGYLMWDVYGGKK